jgi:imidazolonepropionase-like amidohydrolase
MKAKGIFAAPTVAILQYYVDEASTPERKTVEEALAMHAREFKRQMAAGVAFVVGSDVGPCPHGGRREMELVVEFGMSAAEVLRVDLLNGRSCWDGTERWVS